MRYYIGTEQECLQADAVISTNCGWPLGGTTNWANPALTLSGGYVIPVPEGSHGFTGEAMQEGVTLPIVEDPEFPEVESE